ncbi:MAG TPA: DUF2182 domain-containing protein, partial [Candidatus Acidoferrum sp.]|nr:DUF2182 domain-containing protein [Candidatus Acidoferrum sp.]
RAPRHQWAFLCSMASGYFAIWLAAGIGLYALGVVFAAAAMQSELFSRSIPFLSGASLIVAGAIQFTRWKMTHLLRCRSQSGCAGSCSQHQTSFRLGCKQGVACCVCCAAPMTIMIVLGMMNPLVMIVVAIIIGAEKFLPQPAIVARLVGISAIIAGVASFVFQRQSIPTESTAEPAMMPHCHCRDCQRSSGGLFSSFVIAPTEAVAGSQFVAIWTASLDDPNWMNPQVDV